LASFIFKIQEIIWGPGLIVFIGTLGVFFTFKFKAVQFRSLGTSFKILLSPSEKVNRNKGDMTTFQALATTLAGAIGTGNIAGVAAAVSIAGVGALFWMWIMTFIAMVIKYCETYLATSYRQIDSDGNVSGSPMHYIEKGLGKKHWALIFGTIGVISSFGTGNIVQANSVADSLYMLFNFPSWFSGLLVATLTGWILLRGTKTIATTSEYLVPFMSGIYILCALYILFKNYTVLPFAFSQIITHAFTGKALIGGTLSASLSSVISIGLARGVLTNEAGLGIPTIPMASSQVSTPHRSALVSMIGCLLSTGIVCSLTGLVITISEILGTTNAIGARVEGATLAANSFGSLMPFGSLVVNLGLILFAFTTIMSWAYCGTKCAEYVFGKKLSIIYKIVFILTIIPSATLEVPVVWAMADILNGLLLYPNLFFLLILSKNIPTKTKHL
jgi:AGCS family alanine or glycine:cation symporter